MLWGSAFLSDIGLLSVLFTPWVPHCTKQQNMLSASLPFLMSYYKLLKGKIAVQSLDRYTEYMCVLFHPFQFTTRFYLFVIMRKWGFMNERENEKHSFFFQDVWQLMLVYFRWREGFVSDEGKIFWCCYHPMSSEKIVFFSLLLRHTSSYTWKNRLWKRYVDGSTILVLLLVSRLSFFMVHFQKLSLKIEGDITSITLLNIIWIYIDHSSIFGCA